MEQPLRMLFLHDLRPYVNVRFRTLFFLVVSAVGIITIWAFYGNKLGLTYGGNPTRLVHPFLMYIAWGLITALLSFKWERTGT